MRSVKVSENVKKTSIQRRPSDRSYVRQREMGGIGRGKRQQQRADRPGKKLKNAISGENGQ